MKRKVFIITLILLVAISGMSFAYNGEDNASIIGLFDYEVLSPRNVYHNDNVELSFTNVTDTYTLQFKVYNIDNNTLVDTIERTIVSGTTSFDQSVFSGITFPDNNTYEYEIVEKSTNTTLFKGFVAKTPSVDWREGSVNAESEFYDGITIGDSVYNDIVANELLFDENKVNQTVFKDGDYFVIHYKFSSTDDTGGNYVFYHENSTQQLTIDYRDIYNYQGSEVLDARRNFIVVPVSGDQNEIYDYDTEQFFTTLDNPITFGFDKGVYTYMQVDPDTTISAYGQTDLVISNNNIEWDFYLDNGSIGTGHFVYTNTVLNTEEVYNVYGDITLSDLYLGNNYTNQYDSYSNLIEFSYRLVDQGTEEDSGEQRLYIQANNTLAETGFGFENYSRRLDNTYEIRFAKEIGDALQSLLESFGLGGTSGNIFFSAIVILGSAIAMGYARMPINVIGLVLVGLISALAFIGLLPVWFVLLTGIFGSLALFTKLGGGK